MSEHTVLLRFSDLSHRGICRNREQLRVLQREHGFPAGFLLTPNARTWTEREVEHWLLARRSAYESTVGVSAESV